MTIVKTNKFFFDTNKVPHSNLHSFSFVKFKKYMRISKIRIKWCFVLLIVVVIVVVVLRFDFIRK